MATKNLVPIVLPADPSVALEAATKQYVDGKVGSGAVRRRDTRPSQNFPISATTQTMIASVTSTENVGGITYTAGSGGGYNVPVDGTYAVRFSVSGGTSISTTCQLIVNISAASTNRVVGTGNTNQGAVYVGWVAATDLIQFNVTVPASGSFDAIPVIEITKVDGIGPAGPTGPAGTTSWTGTQASFDAITSLDTNTYYFVTP